MGIAQRTIHVKFAMNSRIGTGLKPLSVNIKTIGELILAERQAKNLTAGHVALKMGIAASLVSSWEDGSVHPDDRQLELLAKVFDLRTVQIDNA